MDVYEVGTDEFRDARIELMRIVKLFIEHNVVDEELIAVLESKLTAYQLRSYRRIRWNELHKANAIREIQE